MIRPADNVGQFHENDRYTIVKRPRVISDPYGNESISVRSVCYVPLTYDHRLIDGADAGRFVTTIKRRLEDAAFEAELGM